MTLGMNGLGLDADRARDELAATLGEIERRLTPAHVRERVAKSVRSRPVSYVTAGLGLVAGLVGVALLVTRGARRRG